MFIPWASEESERPKHTAHPNAGGAEQNKARKAVPRIRFMRIELTGN